MSAWALTYKIMQVPRKPACFDNLPRDHEAGGISGGQALDEVYLPTTSPPAGAPTCSGCYPEADAAFVASGGGNGAPPAAVRRLVVIVASG